MDNVEFKSLELNLLRYFRDVCSANGLSYFLGYGTLLGAVRHKGFIPWDDDIDVWMPREDYEKFIDVECKKNHSRYKLFSPAYDKDYYYAFAKIVDTKTVLEEVGFQPIPDYGIYIDIFPLDNVPKKHKIFLWSISVIQILRTASVNLHPKLNLTHRSRALIFKILGVLGRFFFFHKSVCLSNKLVQLYNFRQTPFVGILVEGGYEKYIFDRKLLKSVIDIEFENELYPVPENYNAILTRIYGDDYMILPPLEKQKSVHSFKVRYKDDSDKDLCY